MFSKKQKLDDEELPAIEIKRGLSRLLACNGHTRDAEVGEMYLGDDIFVARLRRPKVIEGRWTDTDRTADLFDLMDDHQRGGS